MAANSLAAERLAANRLTARKPAKDHRADELARMMRDVMAEARTADIAGIDEQTWPVCAIDVHIDIVDVGSFKRPFVVRNFSGLSRDRQLFERELAREPEIWGYNASPMDNSEVDAITLPGADVLARYRNRKLDFNIVDSECSDPAPLLTQWPDKALKVPPSVSWILTLAPARTYFHCDPPYGDCFMYLCEGHKVWLFIAPEDIAEIERRHGFATVNRLALPELLDLDGGFLRGRILIGEIRGGDFIYFPQDWAHYVRTLEDSFGYGGYFGAEE